MRGLLLTGGKSSRMGEDKAQLILRDGLTQQQRGLQLLNEFCDHVHLSTRHAPATPDTPAAEPDTIHDAFGNIGPLGAIASAQATHPHSPWLILACDLPLLEKEHLHTLIHHRDPSHDATAYTSAIDGLPEPLCAIWEPTSRPLVREQLTTTHPCPRNTLLSLHTKLLPTPGLWPLANSNTPADLIEIKARLQQTNTEKKITLQYFASFKEHTNTSSETIVTDCETVAGLYEEIRARYQLPLKRKHTMVAVDDEFTDWTHPLADQQNIVFMPPVAGG